MWSTISIIGSSENASFYVGGLWPCFLVDFLELKGRVAHSNLCAPIRSGLRTN